LKKVWADPPTAVRFRVNENGGENHFNHFNVKLYYS
jgi:hypothetical protein